MLVVLLYHSYIVYFEPENKTYVHVHSLSKDAGNNIVFLCRRPLKDSRLYYLSLLSTSDSVLKVRFQSTLSTIMQSVIFFAQKTSYTYTWG